MTYEQFEKMRDVIGRNYDIDRKESELKEIELDLEEILGCFIKCEYNCMWSHKHKVKGNDDYVINYMMYKTKEDKETDSNGEAYELYYLKGNGKYIVITSFNDI